MKRKYDSIKYFGTSDLAFGLYIEKAIAFADAYGSLKLPVGVNEAIELFNIR